MIILGLDPGLGTTGWGLIRAEGNRLSHPRQRAVEDGQRGAAARAGSPISMRCWWR